MPTASIRLIDVEHVDQFEAVLGDVLEARPPEDPAEPQPWTYGPTVLFLMDAAHAIAGSKAAARLSALVDALARVQNTYGFGVSPYSVHVYGELNEDRVYSRTWCTTRQRRRPPRSRPRWRPRSLSSSPPRAAPRGACTSSPGPIVSRAVQDAAALARAQGNPVLRGPNEHSLACGALARWQLRAAPFLIIVTSGMADELKGTLANLRVSQTRGFIVIGENEPGTWQPFQSTMHDHENAQASLSTSRRSAPV